MKHGFIVPLIGGQAIGQSLAFGSAPSLLRSWPDFAENDSHARAWWPDTPFELIGEPLKAFKGIDVMGSTCPCAGLSTLSRVSSASSKVNDWLYSAAEHVLCEINPKVYWGENAPALSSQMGWAVANRLYSIGKRCGYTFSMYRTKSLLHGLPQVRNRTFFFFWKRDDHAVPVLPWIDRGQVTIEEWFKTERPKDKFSEVFIRDFKPSSMDAYRFLLERFETDHADFVNQLDRTIPITHFMHTRDLLNEAIEWLKAQNSSDLKHALQWKSKYDNMSAPFERYIVFPKTQIGAFVNPLPYVMTHPFEDRFLNLREMLDLMGLPLDFTFQYNKRNLLHITQNVPVQTARDVASLIKQYLSDELDMTSYENGWLVFDNCRRQLIGWPAGE